MIFIYFFGAFIIFSSTSLPISIEDWLIIRDDNNSDIMFQYFKNGKDLIAFPIFLRPDGINDTYPNSTCGPKPFSDLCPLFGPLRDLNTSKVLKCTPNGEGFEPLLLDMGPFMGLARTAMNLGIAFPVLFLFGFTLLMRRRLYPSDSWIENRLCLTSRRSELNERTRSEYEAL
jgi:hypothetical protein